nr:MAG TPA: hypothetical protein [Caudoviricetes sp.]
MFFAFVRNFNNWRVNSNTNNGFRVAGYFLKLCKIRNWI